MMEKRLLKKRAIIVEETVSSMDSSTCNKYCIQRATCGCGSMPGEYGGSYDASRLRHFSGQFDRFKDV